MRSYVQFAKPSVKLSKQDLEVIKKILESGWFCEGKYVKRLERYFRETYKVKYAIACANCTSGLIIALKAVGIKNMKVAVQSFTWPSILYALQCNSNTPVWCDIDKNSWNIEPKNITHCNAVIITDTFGNEAHIDTNLPVIVDAAHGFGLPNLGKRGLIEVVSFSFTKPVTGGQGGIILTNDNNIYEEAKELVRLSAKMLEISAYIILKEINNYENKLDKKLELIYMYREFLTHKVFYQEQKIDNKSNHSVYSILLESKEKRDRIVRSFRKNQIEVKTYYEPLVKGLENTDYIYNRIISLPTYSEMQSEIYRICNLINKA